MAKRVIDFTLDSTTIPQRRFESSPPGRPGGRCQDVYTYARCHFEHLGISYRLRSEVTESRLASDQRERGRKRYAELRIDRGSGAKALRERLRQHLYDGAAR